MRINFFQESLFRMGVLEPVTDFSSEKVVEAYVILDSDTSPEETAKLNSTQLILDLMSKKDTHYHGQEEKEGEAY